MVGIFPPKWSTVYTHTRTKPATWLLNPALAGATPVSHVEHALARVLLRVRGTAVGAPQAGHEVLQAWGEVPSEVPGTTKR